MNPLRIEVTVNKARIFGTVLMAVALCAVLIACSGGGGKAQSDLKPFDILATVRALEMQTTLDPASVGAALDADLRVDAGQSDDSFTYYRGAVRGDVPAAAVVGTVEVRVPSKDNTTGKGPFVQLTLKQGDAPTMDDVVAMFGPATSVDASPANPRTALVLSYATPRSQLRFGIGTPEVRPVVSATIDRTG